MVTYFKRILSQQERTNSIRLSFTESANEETERSEMREEALLARNQELSEKPHNDIPIVTLSGSRQNAALSDPSPEGTSAHTCSICNKQYAYKISLNKHIKSAHSH